MLKEKKLSMNGNKMQLVEWGHTIPNDHGAALIYPNLPEGEENDEERLIVGFHTQAKRINPLRSTHARTRTAK
jgi:hypothetical protein